MRKENAVGVIMPKYISISTRISIRTSISKRKVYV